MVDVRKVLLVDDEPDIRTIGELSLRDVGGFEVVTAADGAEALKAAASHQPDVILLDVMMPGMDGPTVLARLRDDPATADIPVLFLTAKVQRAEIELYVGLGARGVIHKPFDPLTLPHNLRDMLEVSR